MTGWTPSDDGNADLTSHDPFVNGPPHNTFARLRRDDPVHWTEWQGGAPFWSITRYADILALNRQPDLMSSARGIRMEDQTYDEYLARRTFQETDGAEHMGSRVKVTKAFSKPVIALFEHQIRQLCIEIRDQTLPKDTFDATKDIARQLPMRMLGRIIGTPDEDLPWLVEKGGALIANTDPDFTMHVLDKMTTQEFRMMPFNSPAGVDLYLYARDLMARKAAAGDTTGIPDMTLRWHGADVRPAWEPHTKVVMGDLYGSDGARLALCPRGALKRAVAAWQKHGLTPKVGIELEAFAMLRTPDGVVPYDTPGGVIYGMGNFNDPKRFTDAIWAKAEEIGLPLDLIAAEYDTPQFEFTLTCDDAVKHVDSVVLFRQMAREVALDHGILLTFLPKPIIGKGGSDLHVNLSFTDAKGHNAIAHGDKGDPDQ